MSFYKKFLSNFFGLGSLNIINLIIPLAIIPVVSRTIGAESYGYIMYVGTIQVFLCIIFDYSFSYTSVKEYVRSDSCDEKAKIYIETQLARLLILILVLILTLLLYSFNAFPISDVYLYILPYLIGHLIITPWYFQASSKLLTFSFVVTFFRLLHLAIVVLYSDNHSASKIILFSQTYTYLFAGLFMLFPSMRKGSKYKKLCNYDCLIFAVRRIKKSFAIFIADFAPNLYTNLPNIFLINLVNNSIYFQFNIATKIVGIAFMLQSVISKSLYPILCGKENVKYTYIILLNVIPACIIVYLVCLFPSEVYRLVTGLESSYFLRYIYIMSFGVIFGVLANSIGTNYILVKADGSYYSRLILISCILASIVGFFLILFYKDIGAAWLLTVGRFFVFTASIYCLILLRKDGK
ncbi:hypothetical protein NGY2020029_32410 [Vibrio cholerae]